LQIERHFRRVHPEKPCGFPLGSKGWVRVQKTPRVIRQMCTNSCLSRLSLHEGRHHFRPKLRYQFSVGMVRMKDTPSVLVFLLLAKLTAIPGVGSTKNSESQTRSASAWPNVVLPQPVVRKSRRSCAPRSLADKLWGLKLGCAESETSITGLIIIHRATAAFSHR